jgi:hypothetical protein
MTLRIVAADVAVSWDNSIIPVSAGTLVDVAPSSALTSAQIGSADGTASN